MRGLIKSPVRGHLGPNDGKLNTERRLIEGTMIAH